VDRNLLPILGASPLMAKGSLPKDVRDRVEHHNVGSANQEETGGVVRLAAADVIGVEVLPAILSEFRSKFPTTVIELSLSNEMADLLRRDADIAVRMARPRQKAFLAKRAGKVALGFHAHRRYLERCGYPERLEDLAHHTLIGFDRALPFSNLFDHLAARLAQFAAPL
jgi:DNA-binding transcriptional LysR family regulator